SYAGLNPADNVCNARHVDRHLFSRGVLIWRNLGKGLPIGSLPLEQLTRGRWTETGPGRWASNPLGTENQPASAQMPEPGDGLEPVTVQTTHSGPQGFSRANAVDDAAPIGCVARREWRSDGQVA